MANQTKYHGSSIYRIKLKGRLDPSWSNWLGQMAICSAGDETILKGPVADQAALHGLLIRIRDLNLTLLSVERLEPVEPQSH